MNNRERAQQIADENGNDAFNVALAMIEEQNEIKAEAVREAANNCAKFRSSLGPQIWKSDLVKYANQLEKNND